jgi:hypothetical protein
MRSYPGNSNSIELMERVRDLIVKLEKYVVEENEHFC